MGAFVDNGKQGHVVTNINRPAKPGCIEIKHGVGKAKRLIRLNTKKACHAESLSFHSCLTLELQHNIQVHNHQPTKLMQHVQRKRTNLVMLQEIHGTKTDIKTKLQAN